MKNIKSKIKKILQPFRSKNKQIEELQQRILSQQKFINELITYQIHCQEDNPVSYPIALSDAEQKLLKKYLNKSKNYLEFGAGGSTFLAIQNHNLNIYSVESDLNWIKYLSSWKIMREAISRQKLHFKHIDIGATGEWGVPKDMSQKGNFYKYSFDIFENIPEEFDTVLVDGRFRVACVLKTIIHCGEDTAILIHDYPEREYYHIIEKYLEIIENADSLYIFKKKSEIDYNEIKLCYEKYKEDVR